FSGNESRHTKIDFLFLDNSIMIRLIFSDKMKFELLISLKSSTSSCFGVLLKIKYNLSNRIFPNKPLLYNSKQLLMSLRITDLPLKNSVFLIKAKEFDLLKL